MGTILYTFYFFYHPPTGVLEPPSCFVNAITWKFDEELSKSLPYQVPTDCPSKHKYVPFRVHRRLITWAHTSPARGHLSTHHTYEFGVMIKEHFW